MVLTLNSTNYAAGAFTDAARVIYMHALTGTVRGGGVCSACVHVIKNGCM